MERKSKIQPMMAAVVLAGVSWLVTPGIASALEASGPNECVDGCMAAARECEAPVREAAVTCREDAGCEPLADAAREACEADSESEACDAARAAVRECLAPCKEAQKTGLDACRSAALACVRDECGLEGLPRHCGRPARGE